MTALRAHRRLLATFAVLLYACVAGGLPLPGRVNPSSRSSDERFPCENCRCGCATAEQCWRNCCCHTLEQRLAWAEREGVTPPAEIVAREVAKKAPRKCCCCRKAEPTSSPPKRSKNSRAAELESVVVWRAMACQGLSTQWLMIGSAPLPEPLVWAPLSTPPVVTPALSSPCYISISLEPTTPPPEPRV